MAERQTEASLRSRVCASRDHGASSLLWRQQVPQYACPGKSVAWDVARSPPWTARPHLVMVSYSGVEKWIVREASLTTSSPRIGLRNARSRYPRAAGASGTCSCGAGEFVSAMKPLVASSGSTAVDGNPASGLTWEAADPGIVLRGEDGGVCSSSSLSRA